MPISDVQVVVADTDTARRLHYQLRYQVFCLETGFEDASNYLNGQEQDEFDDRSVHFIVRSKRSKEWLATARLILPGERPLPIVRYCDVPLHTLPFARTAEFSRLLIARHVRRRHGDEKTPRKRGSIKQSPTLVAYQERHQTKNILVALIRAMAAYGLERDIPGAAFFITRALARILTQMGIGLTAIGAPCRHRGIRFPYISRAEQVYSTLTSLVEHDGSESHLTHHYELFSELYNTKNPSLLEEPFVERFGT